MKITSDILHIYRSILSKDAMKTKTVNKNAIKIVIKLSNITFKYDRFENELFLRKFIAEYKIMTIFYCR